MFAELIRLTSSVAFEKASTINVCSSMKRSAPSNGTTVWKAATDLSASDASKKLAIGASEVEGGGCQQKVRNDDQMQLSGRYELRMNVNDGRVKERL